MGLGMWLLEYIGVPVAGYVIAQNYDECKKFVTDLADSVTRIKLLTYEEVRDYIENEQPSDKRIAKAVIHREGLENKEGFNIYVIFLDENGKIVLDGGNRPYGQMYRVREIDEEFVDMFDGTDDIFVN